MKILVVDDEVVSREKMEFFMKSYGEVETADTAEACVKSFSASLVKGEPFDLITLDIMMPDSDGLRTLIKLRTLEKEIHAKTGKTINPVKIMMVTSRTDKTLILGCMKAGASHYLVKPGTKEAIKEKMKVMGFKV
ncbi:MAG: response regulator [Desulfobacterales bacterium]|nr:response regulator [Desulfobacterales bacterium]